MREIDTNEYVTMLRELVEEGKSVNLLVAGNSMSPFIIHHRDYIYFRKPDRRLKAGDMVFYRRDTGQYVMHRICKVAKRDSADEAGDVFDIVGDNQTEIEHGVRRDQIFAIIFEVKRKGKFIRPGDFWWEFFEKVWIRIIPLRRLIIKIYGIFYENFAKKLH